MKNLIHIKKQINIPLVKFEKFKKKIKGQIIIAPNLNKLISGPSMGTY